MSAGTSVLFDIPGPKARRRYLILSVVGVALVVVAVAYLIYQLRAQLTWPKWQPFFQAEAWTAYIYPGLFMTLQAAAVAVLASSVLGFFLGMGRLSTNRILNWSTSVFVEFFRSVPVLLMMIFAYFAFMRAGLLTGDMLSLAGVVTGLTLYNSCVMAELLRSGVHGLPTGQREAGLAIGLTRSQTLRSILIPQAITAMLPSLVTQLVVILKDTALGYIISYPELVRAAQTLAAYRDNLVVSFIVVAVIFIIVNSSLTSLAQRLEHRLRSRRAGGRATALPDLVPPPDPNEPMYADEHRYSDPASSTR